MATAASHHANRDTLANSVDRDVNVQRIRRATPEKDAFVLMVISRA